MIILGLVFGIVMILAMLIAPIRRTVFGGVSGGWFWLMNQGPRIRLLIYITLGYMALVLLLTVVGYFAHSTTVITFMLLMLLLPYFLFCMLTSLSQRFRPAERVAALIFMFFTPLVVFLMGNSDLAFTEIGIMVMAGYFTFGLFFWAVGNYMGKITNAPAYFLTLCFLVVVGFTTYRNIAPDNYQAHKLSWERKGQQNTTQTNRNSFTTGLDASATIAKIITTAEMYGYDGTDFTLLGTVVANTAVAVVNHGTEPIMWGDEQMTRVRLKNGQLFTGTVVWISSRYLERLQSPLDFRPPKPLPSPIDSLTVSIRSTKLTPVMDVNPGDALWVYNAGPDTVYAQWGQWQYFFAPGIYTSYNFVGYKPGKVLYLKNSDGYKGESIISIKIFRTKQTVACGSNCFLFF